MTRPTELQRRAVYVGAEVTITAFNGPPIPVAVLEAVVVLEVDAPAGVFLAEAEDGSCAWVALSRVVA